jgi:hypothetical protein
MSLSSGRVLTALHDLQTYKLTRQQQKIANRSTLQQIFMTEVAQFFGDLSQGLSPNYSVGYRRQNDGSDSESVTVTIAQSIQYQFEDEPSPIVTFELGGDAMPDDYQITLKERKSSRILWASADGREVIPQKLLDLVLGKIEETKSESG